MLFPHHDALHRLCFLCARTASDFFEKEMKSGRVRGVVPAWGRNRAHLPFTEGRGSFYRWSARLGSLHTSINSRYFRASSLLKNWFISSTFSHEWHPHSSYSLSTESRHEDYTPRHGYLTTPQTKGQAFLELRRYYARRAVNTSDSKLNIVRQFLADNGLKYLKYGALGVVGVVVGLPVVIVGGTGYLIYSLLRHIKDRIASRTAGVTLAEYQGTYLSSNIRRSPHLICDWRGKANEEEE